MTAAQTRTNVNYVPAQNVMHSPQFGGQSAAATGSPANYIPEQNMIPMPQVGQNYGHSERDLQSSEDAMLIA